MKLLQIYCSLQEEVREKKKNLQLLCAVMLEITLLLHSFLVFFKPQTFKEKELMKV